MRDIKFRWKRVDNWERVYGGYFIQSAEKMGIDCPLAVSRICPCIMVYWDAYYHIELESVWQFTWNKDKLWNDIYEGDVIRKHCDIHYKNLWWYPPSREAIDIYRNYMYEWGGLGFGLVRLNEDPIWYFETWWTQEEEVIWNIYENPELLQK